MEWLKQPGDKVARGESVLVVESDKADMDVESFQDGYLAAVLMPAGSTAPVGETIGLIVETEAEIADAQAKAPSAPAAAAAPAPAPAPGPIPATPGYPWSPGKNINPMLESGHPMILDPVFGAPFWRALRTSTISKPVSRIKKNALFFFCTLCPADCTYMHRLSTRKVVLTDSVFAVMRPQCKPTTAVTANGCSPASLEITVPPRSVRWSTDTTGQGLLLRLRGLGTDRVAAGHRV